MNRVILNGEDEFTIRLPCKDGDEFTLTHPSIHEHITQHIKAKKGQELKVTLLNEGIGRAKIIKLGAQEVTLKVTEVSPGPKPTITLLIGACRPPTVKKILEHGSSLGVCEFIFFQADLSEKSYLTSKVFEDKKIYELLTLGLSQGATFSSLPVVKRTQSLREGLSLIEGNGPPQNYLLSLTGDQTFLSERINFQESITLAIGPERGWSAKEESELRDQGFKPIVVASSVLRVEMAIFSALGQLAMLELSR
jgi:16S rRNA (uracil1498-N3)-methyltransferase